MSQQCTCSDERELRGAENPVAVSEIGSAYTLRKPMTAKLIMAKVAIRKPGESVRGYVRSEPSCLTQRSAIAKPNAEIERQHDPMLAAAQ